MTIPKRLPLIHTNKLNKLNKFLYDLKKLSKAWYQRLD